MLTALHLAICCGALLIIGLSVFCTGFEVHRQTL